MAYLILEEEERDSVETQNRYYEFDPGNPETLEKIEALLSQRRLHRETTEEAIAELCDASLEQNAVSLHRNVLKRMFGAFIGSQHNPKILSWTRPMRKIGRSLLSATRRYHAGKTRRFSFS